MKRTETFNRCFRVLVTCGVTPSERKKKQFVKIPLLRNMHVVGMEPPYGQGVRYSVIPLVGYRDHVEKIGCAEHLTYYINPTNAPEQ